MNRPLLPLPPALDAPPEFAVGLERFGEAVALVAAGGQAVSYADLAARADRFALRLPKGRKLLVAIEAVADVACIAAYLGALRAGHAVALLEAGALPAFRSRFAPEAVFARQAAGQGAVPGDQGTVQQAGGWRLALDLRGDAALHGDLALVMATSGSTGAGKAVRLSARAVEANAAAIAAFLGLGAAERAALVLPLHYAFGLSVLHSHLMVGASVWLAGSGSGGGGIAGAGFLDGLRRMGATSLSTVPHGVELLRQVGFRAADFPALATLAVAGGALAPARLREVAAEMAAKGGRVFAMYGQTEATARIAFVPPERALSVEGPGLIGGPVPGGRLSLRGGGDEGELLYDGPGVMMGYAEGRADLARGPEVGVLATGDLARREADGSFRLIGRLSRMSKIAGLRIGHDAVEAALAARGLVVAVWGDDLRLQVAVEGTIERAEMARLVGLSPCYLVLRQGVVLPRLANGKVDYPALRAVEVGPVAAGDLVAAVGQVFHPVPVGPGDSFADLAGDSLRHVETAMLIEARLGHLPEGWEAMSLARLQAMGAAKGARPGAGLCRGVDTALAMRALAILAVVTTHQTLWPLYGGAAVMVVLIGLMLARFQQGAIAAGEIGHLLRPLWRVLVPYYLIVAFYALAWGQVPWASVFLVANLGTRTPEAMVRVPYLYWFVEAFTQIMALVVVLALMPPVRRMVRRDPFRFGLWLLGGAVAFRVAFPRLWDLGGLQIFTPAWVAYLAALGWLVAVARGRQRAVVLGLAAPLLAWVAYDGGNWVGSWTKYGAVLAVIALLLYVPRLPLPPLVSRAVLRVAGASYLIYLTHRFVPELLLAPWAGAMPQGVFSALSIAGGVALGIGLFALQRRLGAVWAGLWARGSVRGVAA